MGSQTWWGTRPDDRGPYFSPTEWDASPRIKKAIEECFAKIPAAQQGECISLLAKNRISMSSLNIRGMDQVTLALAIDKPDEHTLTLLRDVAVDPKRDMKQREQAYRALQRAKPDMAVPAMIKVLSSWIEQKTAGADAMVADFVNDTPHGAGIGILDKIAKKGSETESMLAWKALLTVVRSPLSENKSKQQVQKILDKNPMEAGLFLAIAEMNLTGFEKQIEAALKSDNDKTIRAAQRAKEAGVVSTDAGRKVSEMKPAEAIAHAMKSKGDPEKGKRLFVSQGCIACHAIDPDAVQKGPYLGAAGAKFERPYLIESIIDPNAVVAQGFQTSIFTMQDGTTAMGFVTKEAGWRHRRARHRRPGVAS